MEWYNTEVSITTESPRVLRYLSTQAVAGMQGEGCTFITFENQSMSLSIHAFRGSLAWLPRPD